jgi:hypothetical protein
MPREHYAGHEDHQELRVSRGDRNTDIFSGLAKV